MRRCFRCKRDKPRDEYGPRARSCLECHTEVAYLRATRACVECHERKPLDRFDVGPSGWRYSGACRECLQRRREEREVRCRRCKRVKFRREFDSQFARSCSDCRAEVERLHDTRTCFHCHERKPLGEFGAGPSGLRPLGVCDECQRRREEEREVRAAARRAAYKSRTWVEPDGRTMRSCAQCGREGELAVEFAVGRRRVDGSPMYAYQCRRCAARRASEHKKWIVRVNPAARARHNEQNRAWRARNPERAKAVRQRWYAGIKADPVRHRQHLETRRIAATFKAEAEGRTQRKRPDRTGGEHEYVPAMPLALALREQLRGRGLTEGDSVSSRLVGVDERLLRAWSVGERPRVEVGAADSVLTRAGLAWWHAWSEETVRRPALEVGLFVMRPKKAKAPKKAKKARRRYRDRVGTVRLGDLGPDHEMLEHVRRCFEGGIPPSMIEQQEAGA